MVNNQFFVELQKLRESSQNAVAQGNSYNLDEFQEYLHITRDVERNLAEQIQKCSSLPHSNLILVCGNVGDGKSHVLSYLNRILKEELANFKIHNDATESHNPNETSNDTLNRVLDGFRDVNINKATDKIVLAINLGTLSKFLEEYEEEYKKLSDYVKNQKILDTDLAHSNEFDASSNFHHVNFTDYHMYSLTSVGPTSLIISTLLDRLVSNSKNNPFFLAYQNYIQNYEFSDLCPIKYNYEFLIKKGNRDVLVNLIIQAIVKNKVIVSVRSLLNFFFDLIVPINLTWERMDIYSKEIQNLKEGDYLSCLIPNYLFEHPELSSLFNKISELDPCMHRYADLDSNLILLINSDEPKQIFCNFISKEVIDGLMPKLVKDKLNRNELTKLFIRLNFFENQEKNLHLNNLDFKNYMKLLYDFNNNKMSAIKEIYNLVEEAARKWNGDPKKKKKVVINLGRNQLKYRVFKDFKTVPKYELTSEKDDEVIIKFVQEFSLSFKIDNQKELHKIHIDFRLFEILNRILKGYRPNRKDNNNYISFVSLINKFINEDSNIASLEIDKINIGNSSDYELSLGNFGEYKFQAI